MVDRPAAPKAVPPDDLHGRPPPTGPKLTAVTDTSTDPLTALKAAETAELDRVRQQFRAHRDAAGRFAEGTKLRTQAADLDTRGTTLQAAAVTALLDSGMAAADVAAIVGLEPRQVRDLAKHPTTPPAT